ncbi:MAG: hypothetical protein Q9181_005485 [Wetmoreana brouardii]
MRGRWRATLPEPEKPLDHSRGSDGLVMFVLGTRINQFVSLPVLYVTTKRISLIHHSPLGKLSPGAIQIDVDFQEMWREAEGNRVKWGCKWQRVSGSPMPFQHSFYTVSDLYLDLGRTATLVDYSDSERTPTIWLSYWRDLKGLQEFSTSAAHRLGQNNYHAKKYPYMAIMHETFYAPKGCWEAIYHEFPPWGLGQAQAALKEGPDISKLESMLKPHPKQSTMFRRMGREKDGSKIV